MFRYGLFFLIFIISLFVVSYIITRQTPHEVFSPESYNVIFPEKQNKNETLTETELILAIPIYNGSIKFLRKKIEFLIQNIKRYKIFIYGLDSTNKQTLKELRKWQTESPHIILVEPIDPQIKSKHRTIRIAQIRNQILDTIQKESISDDSIIF